MNVAMLNAQSSHLKTEQINVSGNCEMCKSSIEKAGLKKGIAKVTWDSKSKIAELTYDSTKQTSSDILKRIALAGYDNEQFLAPDEAYSKLPECCKYERNLKKNNSEIVTKSNGKEGRNSISSNQKTNQVENLFSAYFDLKDAFVQSDEKSIPAKASELAKQVSLVDMTKLKEDQHPVWMETNKQITVMVAELLKPGDIEKKRIRFSELSQKLYPLAKVSHLNYEVYYQHCPMFNKGADWLSKDSDIKNPFYGNQMLTCGKTVETIR